MKINFNTSINANCFNYKNNVYLRTKPMGMDTVSFSGKTKTNDEKFVELRKEIEKDYKPLLLEYQIASWNFDINSSDENMEKMQASEKKYTDFMNNPKLCKKLQDINKSGGVKDKKLKKSLKELTLAFVDSIKYKDELEALDKKENEISQKFNSYQMTIDGKPVTKTEIDKILETEKDVEARKKAYFAEIASGDLIAEDLRQLVKMRNAFAMKKGYKNYFEMKLIEDYDISPKALDKLLKQVVANTKTSNQKALDKKKTELAKAYGIKKEDLRDYHYGLLSEENPAKAINDKIKSKEESVEISKQAYKNMGYDVDKLPLILDLYPRKNKNTHGFTYEIDYGKDARILANLTNNVYSVETLMHELGHALYTVKTDVNMSAFEQPQTATMTEAVAMMMEDLPRTEGVFADKVSKDVNEKFAKGLGMSEASFVRSSLKYINFEKSMYQNPDQDLKQLWKDLDVKYDGGSEKDEPTNSWATIPHFLTHPAYYQNYFRASLIKVQLYDSLTKKLGKLTKNPKTAQYLNDNIFKYGGSKTDDEFLESITGKPLNAEAFCNRVNRLMK